MAVTRQRCCRRARRLNSGSHLAGAKGQSLTNTHAHARACTHTHTTSTPLSPHQPGRRTRPPQGLRACCSLGLDHIPSIPQLPLPSPLLHVEAPMLPAQQGLPGPPFSTSPTPCPRHCPGFSAAITTSHAVLGRTASPQIHVHLEPQKVTSFGERVFPEVRS